MAKMKQRNDIHCVITEKGLVCENTWIFTTGRIKRMRTYLPFRWKHTNIRPFRQRMGEKAYTRIVLDFSFRRPPINRWNRH